MTQNLDRRRFVQQCTVASVAAHGIGRLPQLASAIEPIVRNGLTNFKFSLAAYSYRICCRAIRRNSR